MFKARPQAHLVLLVDPMRVLMSGSLGGFENVKPPGSRFRYYLSRIYGPTSLRAGDSLRHPG